MNTPAQMSSTDLVQAEMRMLTAAEFRTLAEVPAVIEWLASKDAPHPIDEE